MDDVEDKSGAQIRIATEVCTVVVFVCFTAIWVGATIAVGRALSKEFENSTVIIVCFLVGCFVGFWFLQIGFSIYAPAWLDVSASRGVKKGNDTPALKAWRADAPTPAVLLEIVAFAELPYWKPWLDGHHLDWDPRDVQTLRNKATSGGGGGGNSNGNDDDDDDGDAAVAAELGPRSQDRDSIGARVLMLPTGASVLDVLRRCFRCPLLGSDVQLALHLGEERGGVLLSRATCTAVIFFRGTVDGADAKDDIASVRLVPRPAARSEQQQQQQQQQQSGGDGGGSGGGGGGGCVGKGFADRLTRGGALDRVVHLLRGVGSDLESVYVVGHSLGAAVATVLAAAVAPALPSTRVTLCSFGSPRVGDVAFVRHCASLPNLRSWRVQNELEMVSRVAFWLPRPARYRHVEGHYFLLERGLGWCFPAGALAPFVATQAVNVINWPSYLINVFAGGMMDLKYDGRYHMTGHRNGYAAAIGRVHSWCDQAAWSWNGFSYWCQICTLTVITNLLIWASLLAVVVFTSEDSCRSSNIVQKGAPYFLIINGLCFLGIAASLCIVSRVCRDDVVRGGIVKQAIARSPNSPGNGGAATVQDTVDFLSTAGSD